MITTELANAMLSEESVSDKQTIVQTLSADVAASLVVFLVALPLSLGIAGACNVPEQYAATVGIFSAVIGGIVVGMFAGCPLQVTGPAAGLVVVVLTIIVDPNAGFQRVGTVVFLAGLIQLIAAALSLGQWFRSVVPSVIEGMLAGIGLFILASQFHVMLDSTPPGQAPPPLVTTGTEMTKTTHGDAHHVEEPHFVGVKNLIAIPQGAWQAIQEPQQRQAAILGVLTLATIVVWERFAPRRLRVLPAPLIGVGAAAVLAQVGHLDIRYLSVPDSLFQVAWTLPRLDWAAMSDGRIWMYALTVAIVASAESLITAAAVDRMKTHGRRTNYDRELFSQGIGNTVCGFLGLLPLTGVIVRSSANVRFGGRTRMSTILHGLWMLLFVACFPGVLKVIPKAALAAILVYTGVRLAHPEPFVKLKKFSSIELIIGLATFATVFAFDLLTGIALGMGLAVVRLLYSLTHLAIRREDDDASNRTVLHLNGAATFVGLSKLENMLISIPAGRDVHVAIDDLAHIDHACLESLMHWEQQHSKSGGSLSLDWHGLTALRQPPAKRNG